MALDQSTRKRTAPLISDVNPWIPAAAAASEVPVRRLQVAVLAASRQYGSATTEIAAGAQVAD